MAAEPTNAYEEMFLKSYDQVPQQKRSRIMRAVKPVEEFTTGHTFHYNRVLKATSQIKQGRFSDTPTNPVGHETRIGWRHTRNTNVPVNTQDIRRQIARPTDAYVMAVRAEMQRTLDANFIDALLGDQSKQEVSEDAQSKVISTIALPNSQKIAAGGAGMSLAKLLEALEIFNENEAAGEFGDEEKRYCALGAQQVTNLLNEEKIGSRDYNMLMPLQEGKIVTWGGYTFIRTQLLPKDGSNRRCIAFTEHALKYGSDPDLKKLRIAERPDKSFDEGIYAEWELGSLRCDEKFVVEIACQES